MTKLFTKSVFKLALSCPTKLYYAHHPEQYNNVSLTDEFLEALAEGGFQVGELAKLYRHVDYDLANFKGYDEPLNRTKELFEQENVTAAEAAFRHGNLFVRADIVEKRGYDIHLIEVKAKSFNPDTESFVTKRNANKIATDFIEYIYDVAFQKYVLSQALPGYHIHASLMMADKSTMADINGLNQLFRLSKENGRTQVEITPDAKSILATSGTEVLTAFDVDNLCDRIIRGETAEQADLLGLPFTEFVKKMSQSWEQDEWLESLLGTKCFKCEYRKAESGLLDGHDECWRRVARFSDADFSRPQVAELWGGGLRGRDQWVKDGVYFLDEITEDLLPRQASKPTVGLDSNQRRWLQIGLATHNDNLLTDFASDIQGDTYLDKDGLREEMDKWTYPLHMIDFETTAVALPYYKGLRPYEQVAFQFSHHIIDRHPNGTYSIRHASQYLNEQVNEFPNFHFVRALRGALSQDCGTVFRYASHENTILLAIREQLEASNEPDKDELIAFINDLTEETGRVGSRTMVDLLKLVKSYFYKYTEMHGSNSIKQVLPAVLNASAFLQQRYGRPIYGTEIPSLNISSASPIAWIQFMADGSVDNPYHQLPSVAEYLGISKEAEDLLNESEGEDMIIANGGAALTAYSKLMFCQTDGMDQALRTALLRYCELDTMAMVFIWEYFYHETR